MAYLGMLFCNLVAIPITKALVFWNYFTRQYTNVYNTIINDYGAWIMIAAGMVLFSSVFFFMAAMVVVFQATTNVMIQSPMVVKLFYWFTMIIYILFAVAGIVTIGLLISYASQIQASSETVSLSASRGFKRTIKSQVMTYEVLNLGKAVLGIYFMAGMLTATGLSL